MTERALGTRRDIFVIGASAGGVSALLTLARALPPDLPAAVLVVLHVGANPSVLSSLMTANGKLPAVHAEDGQHVRSGVIHIAPPDRHMLVEDGVIKLTRDAKEHHARPAIDPLFRSAALAYGPRVIGVVLTGRLNDGTAGLQAVKEGGGVAVVQDPADAAHESMPQSALRSVQVDRCVPLSALGDTLVELVNEPLDAPAAADETLKQVKLEHDIGRGTGDVMAKLNAAGTPSEFSCPACDGVLWEMNDDRMRRFRCHTGHAYSLLSLQSAQRIEAEEAVWGAMRALQVRARLFRALATESSSFAAEGQATARHARADKADKDAASLRDMVPDADDQETGPE
jgi:two-component system chemotaxis response regulator CheB